jgi:pimeloyl-ACP methyl ester carboxylesterase
MTRKPVIFIPGFPASELHDVTSGDVLFPPPVMKLLDPAKKSVLLGELETIPGNVEAGLPIASILGGVVQEAQSIYNILHNQYGYDVSWASNDFVPVGWDWRQSISAPATVKSISEALDHLSPQKDGKVVAILHSTGGLVFRAFLDAKPEYAACFDQVLTFGIPWAGTLESLHAVTKGVSIGFLFIKLLSSAEGQGLMGCAVAAYDLLPTVPSLNLFFDQHGNATTPLTDQSWINQQFMRDAAAQAHGPFPQIFDTLPLTNVCGWGAKTWTTASINATAQTVDFKAPDKEAGDGTVPFISSSWLLGANVRSMYLPIGAYATGFIPKVHGQLWDSPPVLQLFDEVLKNASKTPFLCAAADSDDYLDYSKPVRLRVSAMAGDGSALPNLVINVNLDGKRTAIPLDPDGKRGFILISRANIHHNIEPDLYRFNCEYTWTGGSDKRAVLIRSV